MTILCASVCPYSNFEIFRERVTNLMPLVNIPVIFKFLQPVIKTLWVRNLVIRSNNTASLSKVLKLSGVYDKIRSKTQEIYVSNIFFYFVASTIST